MRYAMFMLIGSFLIVACAPRATEGDFHSDNPASKLYAISRAGEKRDKSAIPDLVDLLEHDDPAVRMMSIQALERITGERLGYDPYATPPVRRPAVRAWVAAVEGGRFK